MPVLRDTAAQGMSARVIAVPALSRFQPYSGEIFMPRDNDKNNDSSRGRRGRPGSGKGRTGDGKGRAGGGKGRSGAARGREKKFAKRGFAGKSDDGERRPYAGKPDRVKPYEKKPYEKKPYSSSGKPYAGKRDD